MDMAGNVWEWQANYFTSSRLLSLRGGSYDSIAEDACVSEARIANSPEASDLATGFRVAILPSN
jgi:formylglycine-generating enzyme required for sulfatase activity